MRRISKDKIILLATAILSIILLNQSYYPFLGKIALTSFFSVLMQQRIQEKTPRILAQSLLWGGLILAGIYNFYKNLY